jgi:2'-5' RNA ligase
MKTSATIFTYWLIPAEPERSYFAELIKEFAGRFDAPIFEPHLTLYATGAGNEKPGELLNHLLAETDAPVLPVSGIHFSNEFTKTVFVQFEPDGRLTELSAKFRRASACQNDYQLNPHLSLIYKTMASEMKAELAHSIRLPFDEVRFASAKAVISPAEISAPEHVEAWRVLAAGELRP